MVQLLIMYNQPADPAAFNEYYFKTHVPIFAETPGIRAVTFSKGPIVKVAGNSDIYLVAEVTFDSMDALQAALTSKPAQDAIADLPNFAGAGVSIVAFEMQGQ
jgi:uncharacterized protein (TIGR02118 family)